MRELLLLLCRYPFEEKDRETLSKLIGKVKDWHKMAELINAHGIIALAAYNIKEAGLEEEIPENAMAILKNGYLQSIVRNTWLTERWKEVNTILCNAGIKHILLKGMALEHTLYGAKGLRQMNDNDILVKREYAQEAWHLLQENGFVHELIKSPIHKKYMLEIGKHLPCLYKNGYAIEIHHKLFESEITGIKDYEDPVDTAVEIIIGGTKARILSSELQMMHLINHFERHALEGNVQLRQYADILLLDKTGRVEMPESFMYYPQQETKFKYRKAAYKINLRSIAAKDRLRYLTGDIFPSLKWMKERYKCNWLKALLYYPLRIGKLVWLI